MPDRIKEAEARGERDGGHNERRCWRITLTLVFVPPRHLHGSGLLAATAGQEGTHSQDCLLSVGGRWSLKGLAGVAAGL
jgi:hypothetical protein